ncbi:MAG: HAD hydrolase family protein [Campylobacterales bacterium]|nr:HAD hydrolase family protein [Campylobacterales bacterium]
MIKMLVLDVDGCMTDGRIIYGNDGNETKSFDVKDGLAIRSWLMLGHEAMIITGRRSELVSRRAAELGITLLFQGVKDKAALLREHCDRHGLQPEEVAAIGDDLNDYEMLRFVGHAFIPSDAARQMQALEHTCLQHGGGRGAVREMIEMLIAHNGEEAAFMALWTSHA